MRKEITDFVKKACKKHGLKANYLFEGDIYVVHKDGYAVQNFTSEQFYQIPKRVRMEQYEPLVRLGLNVNLQANHKKQMVVPWHFGHKIV